MHRAIRSLALALALLVLASGAVHARPVAVHPSPTGFLDALWQWAASCFPAWTKEGGMMDPNGAPRSPATSSATSDEGGTMDPNGYKTKAGSDLDPNGRPHLLAPPSTTDAGGMMDPDG
ncbi:MAG TPA: hypothetical protein VGH73_19350, partial [Thermoanaerobaculia bacterium]|jgi:hypothetical protein